MRINLPLPLKLIMATFLTFSTTCSVAAQKIECPTELPAETIRLEAVPSGWKFFADSPLYLHSAAPMGGPPEMLAHLVPDAEHHKTGQQSLTYFLDWPSPEGKWIQCGYGVHDEVTLSKRIEDNTTSCVVTYRKGKKAGQNNVQIDCK